MSSLLELGAGFHPELTGRENVFLAGAIMGIPQARMRERFDAIVEFAELAQFIDQPVKHYSSGMYVRLGFAVAVEVDPDILLIDEVLAVGDASFQRRCLDRMARFREERKTMLIISHDMDTIRKVSDRILYLEKGSVRGLGEPTGVLEAYASASRQDISDGLAREWGTGEVLITGVDLLDAAGQPAAAFSGGDALIAKIHFTARERVERPVFGFGIANREGHVVHGNNTQNAGVVIDAVEGEGAITLRLEQLDVGNGTYLLSFSVHSEDHRKNYHRLDHHFPISVKSDAGFEGCHLPSSWEV
jgi:energy-coupling factor transporter ATP-binding protein EcfA2